MTLINQTFQMVVKVKVLQIKNQRRQEASKAKKEK